MKRWVFKNIAEWVSTNEKGNGTEQLITGLKVYEGKTEASASFFQRPFYSKINDRYLFIRQHPNVRNDELIIPLNQIAHTRDQLKALLLGAVSAEVTALQAGISYQLTEQWTGGFWTDGITKIYDRTFDLGTSPTFPSPIVGLTKTWTLLAFDGFAYDSIAGRLAYSANAPTPTGTTDWEVTPAIMTGQLYIKCRYMKISIQP